MKKFLWLIFFLPVLACKKEEEAAPAALPEIRNGEMVLVCSEGNFRWNNAEAGLLNLQTGAEEWKAFAAKNGRPPGDVLQSAAFWDGKLWLVVNNSGRLEGLNPADFSVRQSIGGLTSPRFLQAVSGEKAYVSDLYANALWIIRRGSNQATGNIPMPGWTEEMLFSGGKLWVLCREQPYLLGINPLSDQVSDTLPLPGKGTSLAAGKEGTIWAAFEHSSGSAPGIALLHPDSNQALSLWNTPQDLPAPDRLQAIGDTLFFLNSGLCRIQKSSAEMYRFVLPQGNWYGLGLDPVRRQLWLSDVKDYQQRSRILRLDMQGKILQQYSGGIISSRFYFW